MSICLGFEWDFLFSQAQAAPGRGNGDTRCLRSKIYYYTLIHLSQKKHRTSEHLKCTMCRGNEKTKHWANRGENEPTLPVTSQRCIAWIGSSAFSTTHPPPNPPRGSWLLDVKWGEESDVGRVKSSWRWGRIKRKSAGEDGMGGGGGGVERCGPVEGGWRWMRHELVPERSECQGREETRGRRVMVLWEDEAFWDRTKGSNASKQLQMDVLRSKQEWK